MTSGPQDGLLRAEHFQIAYVTNDLDRACAVFGEQYGVKAFSRLDADLPDMGEIHIRLAWVGGVMLELIQAAGPGMAFYNDRLPADAFAIRHHHFGYLVDGVAPWEALRRRVEAEGRPIPFEGGTAAYMRFFYVEAADLGHYLEYFVLGPDGNAFFENVPAT